MGKLYGKPGFDYMGRQHVEFTCLADSLSLISFKDFDLFHSSALPQLLSLKESVVYEILPPKTDQLHASGSSYHFETCMEYHTI